MQFNLMERTFINTEVLRHGKQLSVCYLLVIFFGFLGLHRFYLEEKMTAFIQLFMTITGLLTLFFILGYLILMIVALWLIIDAFWILGKVKTYNSHLEETLKIFVTKQRKDDSSIIK